MTYKYLIAFVLYSLHLTCLSQKKYDVFEKKDFSFTKSEYSIIIKDIDTLYSNGIIQGKHVPVFDKKMSGQYFQFFQNSITFKSYVLNGYLTGYYIVLKNDSIFEEGYFENGLRRIVSRNIESNEDK